MRVHPLLLVAPALCIPAIAQADDSGPGVTVNPGLIASGIVGRHGTTAIGGELSFMLWPDKDEIVKQAGIGGFAQAQRYGGGFGRYAFGVQAGSILGAELGFAHRDQGPVTRSSEGAHLGVFLSLGVLVLTLRSTIPVSNGEGPRDTPGAEFAGAVSVKIPLPFNDVGIVNLGSQGRLLRNGDTVIAPPVTAIAASGANGERARRWARDGACELASVPAFLRLAEELRVLGAPASLVRRAMRAAIEEVGHADACFRLASRFAGHPVAAGPLDLPAPRVPDLATLALEAHFDGVLGEGDAARKAADELALEGDPAVRAVLTLIAREEAAHGVLSEHVLSWARSRGGRVVERALGRADLPVFHG